MQAMIAEEACASHALSSAKIMADIFESANFGGVLCTVLAAQSYQKVSLETFWYDWGQKPAIITLTQQIF
jgi:hypothetical protein